MSLLFVPYLFTVCFDASPRSQWTPLMLLVLYLAIYQPISIQQMHMGGVLGENPTLLNGQMKMYTGADTFKEP